MTQRDCAFKAGILRFCKSAGYDSADSAELVQLLTMPARDGAKVVAQLVLDRREQQVKEAGASLCKKAELDLWAPQTEEEKAEEAKKFAVPQHLYDEITKDMSAEEAVKYESAPTVSLANQWNTSRGHDPNLWQFQDTFDTPAPEPSTTEAPTTGTTTEQPTPTADTAPEDPIVLDAFKQDKDTTPDSLTGTTTTAAPDDPNVTTLDSFKKDPNVITLAGFESGGNRRQPARTSQSNPFTRMRDAISQKFKEDPQGFSQEQMGEYGYTDEMMKALNRHATSNRLHRQVSAASGVRMRPGQVIAGSGKSTGDAGLDAFGDLTRKRVAANRAFHENLYGPRQSAGHHWTRGGLRSGVHAPRTRRGRGGGGTVAQTQQARKVARSGRTKPPTVQQREKSFFGNNFKQLAAQTRGAGGSVQFRSPAGSAWAINKPKGEEFAFEDKPVTGGTV